MMRRVGVGLALLLSACAQSTDPEPSASGSAFVTGLFSVDGTPIAGAHVELHSRTSGYNDVYGGFSETNHLLATTMTADDGSYQIEVRGIQPDVCEGFGSVLLRWGPTRAVAYPGSPCENRAGVDFSLSTDTIVGRVVVNGQPVAGAGVDLRLCGTQVCGDPLDSVSTAADGSYELRFVGCYDGSDILYTLTANIDVGFVEARSFLDCSSRLHLDLEVSTTVEVTGTVYLDGDPVSGWEGLVLGMTAPCDLEASGCSFTVLASAVTDASGKFHVSHQAEGFQCTTLFIRARPPDDWAGPAPTPTSPGPSGSQRPCGTWPEESFYFETAS